MSVNKNLTEVIAVLDRSSSMGNDINNVLEGYNGFVNEQKKGEGECRFTLYVFDADGFGVGCNTNIDKVYENIHVSEVPVLTKKVYFARGCTPLNDAIGKAIDDTGKRYDSIPELMRPGKVIVFISTDGEENSSKEFPGRGNKILRDKIAVQENEFNWEFVFTAANVDAYELNQQFGFDPGNVMRSSTCASGSACMYDGLSKKLTSYRAGEVQTMNFSAAEKAEVEQHSALGVSIPIPGDLDLGKNLVSSSPSLDVSGPPSTPDDSN